jgi:hypothetical protein
VTGGLSRGVETKISFVSGVGFVIGSGCRGIGEHSEVIRKRGGFVSIETVFDGNGSVNACEASIGPLEVQGWCPVVRLVLYDWPRSALAGAKVLRSGIRTELATPGDYDGGSDYTSIEGIFRRLRDTDLCGRGEQPRRAS